MSIIEKFMFALLSLDAFGHGVNIYYLHCMKKRHRKISEIETDYASYRADYQNNLEVARLNLKTMEVDLAFFKGAYTKYLQKANEEARGSDNGDSGERDH